MSESLYHEWRLFLDGGGRQRLPVRCTGTEADGQIEIYEVWIRSGAAEYNIIDNLHPDVLDDLEAEAAGQIMWEKSGARL